MAGDTSKKDEPPDWYAAGLEHVWLPYAQMKTAAAPLPGDLSRVFFSDSGSVAVEVALKMAAQYWINRGVKRRSQFVAFKGGYHGDTTGAMAVSDAEGGMHALFAGLLPQH